MLIGTSLKYSGQVCISKLPGRILLAVGKPLIEMQSCFFLKFQCILENRAAYIHLDTFVHRVPSCSQTDNCRRTTQERYDTVHDTADWSDLPPLNIRRYLHVKSCREVSTWFSFEVGSKTITAISFKSITKLQISARKRINTTYYRFPMLTVSVILCATYWQIKLQNIVTTWRPSEATKKLLQSEHGTPPK